ncbi:hypothetical protein D9V30_10340 [Mycetocola reblochoni]|uniref:Uncharacterized protein n=2 Tax=Mycetocola reblochoni TaxID=331618 RepID=A0A1R4JQ80_9MICO|nr:hypothetical protein [Mycetocola reblochoni]RLP68379.1 hypothetical protein D9V30_10340 [Mycetocola reblochoni]SJN33955.1 hypothetical protein FM119_08670 [Mycetocola reblochoni REB411]
MTVIPITVHVDPKTLWRASARAERKGSTIAELLADYVARLADDGPIIDAHLVRLHGQGLPDRIIADELGLSLDNVKTRRARMKLPAHRVPRGSVAEARLLAARV